MFKLFTRYLSVGVLNTAIHWIVFYILHYVVYLDQALSNLGAFSIAVTFSFLANARYTFNKEVTARRYISYVIFMGGMSVAVGAAADRLDLAPVLTLTSFSAVSLLCGFFYSKFIIFRSNKQ
ncbi:GtrA family protein [Janthinobacterium sp. NKUCC06_STL]|uniref:GtrA family protein n=1 Tax=Janthinobacterium sp. NKUCC06_STL TaxID=2842127 RepID=UPI001C5A7BEF|nr:GtrA family protein [Janthinobacterium sp. NKUCC06_STL]MBW3508480.1 GtrA family protein [Janthinobacterium sp. NKUCC06_STL]